MCGKHTHNILFGLLPSAMGRGVCTGFQWLVCWFGFAFINLIFILLKFCFFLFYNIFFPMYLEEDLHYLCGVLKSNMIWDGKFTPPTHRILRQKYEMCNSQNLLSFNIQLLKVLIAPCCCCYCYCYWLTDGDNILCSPLKAATYTRLAYDEILWNL